MPVKKIKLLNSLSKNELIEIIHHQDITISKYKTMISCKTAQIRHFRLRITKISDSLRYLLTHPFSMDNGYNTKRIKDIKKNKISRCNGKGLLVSGKKKNERI